MSAYYPGALLSSPNLMLLWKITRKFTSENDPAVNRELFKMGQRLERNGVSVIEKLMGLGVQLLAQDEKKDPVLHAKLKNKHTAYKKLVEKLHGQKGKEDLMDYLKNLYENGEAYALEQL